MRLACGEDNGVRFARRIPRNTDRTARTIVNVAICRTFVRMITVVVPPADER
jgi:hypothetical protein